ncbi:glucosyl-3-phosphoglycerate synthase, partial [Mycobacterium sp. ITM-2017-0098]
MTVLSDRVSDLLATEAVAEHRWLTERSWSRPAWTIAELEAAKKGRTVSVVLPALNEEETVASVVETITPLLGGLVDELIVLDSGSTDDTEIRALAA